MQPAPVYPAGDPLQWIEPVFLRRILFGQCYGKVPVRQVGVPVNPTQRNYRPDQRRHERFTPATDAAPVYLRQGPPPAVICDTGQNP